MGESDSLSDHDGDDPPEGKLPDVLHLFSSSDRKVLIQDSEFWAATFDGMMSFYKESSVGNDEELAAKAVACSRLAGLGIALTEHFSIGVSSVIDVSIPNADTEACEEAATSVYGSCEAHTKRLETRVRKAEN